MKRLSILTLTLFLLIGDLCSQSRSRKEALQVFQLGAVVGLNNSQIDGDFFTGFNKIGMYGGIRGIANFTPRMALHVELLYSQKGSKIPHSTVIREFTPNDRIIDLRYAEVPVLFTAKITPYRGSPILMAGLSLSRLLDTRILEMEERVTRGTKYSAIEQDFRSTELSAIAGIGYEFWDRFQLTARYSFGLSRFYLDPEYEQPIPQSTRPEEVYFLRNYHFSLLLAYRFL